MNETLVENSVENITAVIGKYGDYVTQKVEVVETQTDALGERLTLNAEYRVSALSVKVIPYIESLHTMVQLRLFRVTFHASPEIFAILAAMVAIWNVVTWAIRIFNVVRIIGTLWQVHQIVAALWPRYRTWFNDFLSDVSRASAALGWGVDGIAHLMNAAVGGVNVVGGLFGKDWNMMRFEFMESGNELAMTMSRMLKQLQDDPGRWLNTLFENRNLLQADGVSKWWKQTSAWIQTGLDRAEAAIKGVQSVTGELLMIKANMPEVVRRNIPYSIWFGLDKANRYIDYIIMPRLWQVQSTLNFITSVNNSLSQQTRALADKLSKPGEVLLGVDDLPYYAKQNQLGMIDDVTSREFEVWTDRERAEIQPDLNAFDRIDMLMRASTPQPAYLGLEIPRGKTIRGVTAEPRETWFIGGYNDPR